MDLCETLIMYCVKTYRQSQNKDKTDEPVAEGTDEAQKKIQDFMAKGKMQAFERVDENEAVSKQKKGKKKRDGPSMFYYEDDSKLQLEFPLIQKFSKVQVSPPIEIDEL